VGVFTHICMYISARRCLWLCCVGSCFASFPAKMSCVARWVRGCGGDCECECIYIRIYMFCLRGAVCGCAVWRHLRLRGSSVWGRVRVWMCLHTYIRIRPRGAVCGCAMWRYLSIYHTHTHTHTHVALSIYLSHTHTHMWRDVPLCGSSFARIPAKVSCTARWVRGCGGGCGCGCLYMRMYVYVSPVGCACMCIFSDIPPR